jgi:hypothetical protein
MLMHLLLLLTAQLLHRLRQLSYSASENAHAIAETTSPRRFRLTGSVCGATVI